MSIRSLTLLLMALLILGSVYPANAVRPKAAKCVSGKREAVCHITVAKGVNEVVKTRTTLSCVRSTEEFYCNGSPSSSTCTHVVRVSGQSGTQCIISIDVFIGNTSVDSSTRTFTFK